jgi:hypothetical protein
MVRVAVDGTALDAPDLEPAAQAVRIVGLVHDQASGRCYDAEEQHGHAHVDDVTRSQRKGYSGVSAYLHGFMPRSCTANPTASVWTIWVRFVVAICGLKGAPRLGGSW